MTPETKAFRKIICELVGLLLAIPTATRAGWAAALQAKLQAHTRCTADELLVGYTVMGPAFAMLEDPAGAPAEAPLWLVAVNAVKALAAVPRGERQRWIDEVHARAEAGDRVTPAEWCVAQVLLGLPVTEDIAGAFRQQENLPIG